MARLILIADDSPIIQRKAQRILQDEGFEVQTVSNGVAAVKKLPVMQPVLVLADVSMPGKDGYEVCDFVKTSAGLRHVPVLLVGSDLEPYDEQRGARVRADGIIKKPFTPHDLIAMVRRLTAPAKASASPPTCEGTVASLPVAAQVALTESHAPTSQQVVREGGEEDISSADVEPAVHGVEDGASKVELRVDEPAENIPEGLPRPSVEPSEPFPGLVLGPAPGSGPEPAPDRAPEPALATPETGWEIEESRPEEIEELMLPPELVDLTVPEDELEFNPVFAEPIPEPLPEIAPEPGLIAGEATRVVERSSPQELGELGSSPQLVNLTAAESVPEPGAPIAEPTPQPALEVLPEPAPVAAEPVTESVPGSTPESALTGQEASQEWGDLILVPPTHETPAGPDAEWIYKLVHKVVTRMAPSVLSPEQVEELARMLTREIASEIGRPGGQIDFPAERPSPD